MGRERRRGEGKHLPCGVPTRGGEVMIHSGILYSRITEFVMR
jgi:hypothetical protein